MEVARLHPFLWFCEKNTELNLCPGTGIACLSQKNKKRSFFSLVIIIRWQLYQTIPVKCHWISSVEEDVWNTTFLRPQDNSYGVTWWQNHLYKLTSLENLFGFILAITYDCSSIAAGAINISWQFPCLQEKALPTAMSWQHKLQSEAQHMHCVCPVIVLYMCVLVSLLDSTSFLLFTAQSCSCVQC